jgi:threonine dehydrogenase-like Zn-dependent dehydrogenase
MTCKLIKIGDRLAIICGRGIRAPNCRFCRNRAESLCDFVLGKTRGGKEITCDAPPCHICTQHVEPDLNFCPKHRRAG